MIGSRAKVLSYFCRAGFAKTTIVYGLSFGFTAPVSCTTTPCCVGGTGPIGVALLAIPPGAAPIGAVTALRPTTETWVDCVPGNRLVTNDDTALRDAVSMSSTSNVGNAKCW